MKRKLIYLFLCLFLCVFLAGCGSTEPEETEEVTPVVEAVPEAPVVEDNSAALAEAAAKAEAEKRAAAERVIKDARDAAVKAGASDLLPEQLRLIDENVQADMAGDNYEAVSKKAAEYYSILEKASQGYILYQEIVDKGYDAYAPETFNAALAAVDELEVLWNDNAGKIKLGAKVDEAYGLLEKTKAEAEAAIKETALRSVYDARDAAIKAGAAEYLPEQLAVIDENAEAAIDAEDFEATAKEAASYYRALGKAAQCVELYNEIVEEGYDAYAQDSFGKAVAAIDELSALWDSGAGIKDIEAKVDEIYTLLEKTKSDGYLQTLNQIDQLEHQVQYYRNLALETNAPRDYAEYFAIVDERADEVRAAYEATGDLEACKAAVADIIAGYRTLAEAALAEEAYWTIYDNDWEGRDPVRFEQGWAAYQKIVDLGDEGSEDIQEALVQATIAHNAFQRIVDDAWRNDANAERNRYTDVKKKADAIKANVAAKADYAAAVKLLLDADAAYSRESWDKAFEGYKAAADAMTKVYETVSVKRSAAQDAMDNAKKKAAEVDRLAVQADEIAPLSDEEAKE